MQYIKRSNLNASEVAHIRRCSDGYVWAVLDISENTIAIGDGYLVDLRDSLISKYRCRAKDIFGIGLDLRTGEIYHARVVNRMNEDYRKNKQVPANVEERIETMVNYYFEKFAPFRRQARHVYQTRELQLPSR